MSWLSKVSKFFEGPKVVDRSTIPLPSDPHARRVHRTRDAMGDDAKVLVYANNMAAGPCPACLNLAKNPILLFKAPSGPLPSCPHPDQCVLHWRVVSEFE